MFVKNDVCAKSIEFRLLGYRLLYYRLLYYLKYLLYSDANEKLAQPACYRRDPSLMYIILGY